MLWMLVTILVLLWLVGTLAALTIGGALHLLLLAAAGLTAFLLWRGRRRDRTPPAISPIIER